MLHNDPTSRYNPDHHLYNIFQQFSSSSPSRSATWGLSNQKLRSISESTSLFKDLSNQIKLFQQESRNQARLEGDWGKRERKELRTRGSGRAGLMPVLMGHRGSEGEEVVMKKMNIDFDGRQRGVGGIHTFRVGRGKEVWRKGHGRCLSGVEDTKGKGEEKKIVVSGSQQVINGRKVLGEIRETGNRGSTREKIRDTNWQKQTYQTKKTRNNKENTDY